MKMPRNKFRNYRVNFIKGISDNSRLMDNYNGTFNSQMLRAAIRILNLDREYVAD